MITEFASIAPRPRGGLAAVVDGLEMHLQPIIDTATGAVRAVEALARFAGAASDEAEQAIASAHRAGYGHALETACLSAALARRPDVPDGIALALNVSPDVLASAPVSELLNTDLDGVIIEVTEHWANDPHALLELFATLRGRGASIAVDDVGRGYAGLLRLATMRPDIVKLDRTIVSGARDSDGQCAVLEALVGFSHRIGAKVVGEGVESLDDLATLVQFDVDYGQGWAIGRPARHAGPIDAEVVAACQLAREDLLQRRASIAGAATRAEGMHAVVGAVAGATGLAGLHAAAAQAAAELGVDVISASVLDGDGVLREITSSGAAIDTTTYALADYPATRSVVETGTAMEVHANDPASDPSERALLSSLGHASLLIVPLAIGEHRIGVLEFMHDTHRRWTGTDIADARGLATHLANALMRITS